VSEFSDEQVDRHNQVDRVKIQMAEGDARHKKAIESIRGKPLGRDDPHSDISLSTKTAALLADKLETQAEEKLREQGNRLKS
jgi:hypothetical protein